MSDSSSADAIRSAVAAMNAGDVDGYITHFAPTCERWVSGLDQPVSLYDVAESLRQLVRAFSPLQLDEELLISEGAFVCARWRLRGTQTADYVGLTAGYWWQVLFPALAIASLVIAVNLITDAIEQVLAS